MVRNLYAVLEVGPQADAKEIRSAYRRLARLHHPDHSGGADERFKELAAAYEVLSSDERRMQYDEQRVAWLRAQGAFLCTGCGQGLRIPAGFIGASRCGRCKTVIAAQPTPPPAPLPETPSEQSSVMASVAERLREHGTRVGNRLLIEVADAAEQVSDETVAALTELAVAGVRSGLAGVRERLRRALKT